MIKKVDNTLKTAAIVLNTPVLDVDVTEEDVICADGGLNHAVGSFVPKAVVGDLDSAKKGGLDANAELVICPRIKDYTDGEKAIEYAYEKGYERVIIYGAEGGRSDHVYANFALLALADELGIEGVIKTKTNYVYFAKGETRVAMSLKKGITVSVLPFGEEVTLDDSVGLYYPYKQLTIKGARSGLGISNVTVENDVAFTVRKGEALIFVEKADPAHPPQ